MKVLHLTNYYPPYIGGIGEVCYYIANSFVGEVEQRVLCYNDVNKRVVENIHGVEIYRAKSVCQIHRQQISFDMLPMLRDSFMDFKPDILHLHLPNPLVCIYVLWLLPKNVKLIVHWHSDIIGQDSIYRFFNKYENKILLRSDKIVVTSMLYAKHSKPLQPYMDKIFLLQNIISKEKTNITPEIESEAEIIRSKYEHKPIIFTIGRHITYKGLTYLIEAEKYINTDCIILIGGNGLLTEQLKKQADGRDRIKFIGFLPDDEMLTHMCACKIFAFPSITKNEAFGIALAEAMYCGAVPVTFTIEGSGVNWVCINNESGIEVKNADPVAFAKAIDKLLIDNRLYETMSRNAHARVESLFTLDIIKPKLKDLYISVFNNRK